MFKLSLSSIIIISLRFLGTFQAQFIQMCKTLYGLFTENQAEQQLYHSIATVATLLLKIGDAGKRFYLRKAGLPSLGSFDDCSPTDALTRSLGEISVGLSASESIDSASGLAGSTTSLPEADQNTQKQTSQENNPKVSQAKDANAPEASDAESAQYKMPSSISKQSFKSESGATGKPDSDWSITFEQFLASVLTEQDLVEYFERQVDVHSAIEKYRNRRLIERQNSYLGTPPNSNSPENNS